MNKLAGVFFCLVFAVLFGGVGVWATYAIGQTLHSAMQARSWIKVRASVDSADLKTGGSRTTTYRAEAIYSYRINGQQYTGTRLGLSTLGGGDNIDDWHENIAARLEDARAAGVPITVFVNPDNPAEALVDRSIRWKEILFLTPFSLLFGAVGVGAVIAMFLVLRGGSGTAANTGRASGARVIDRSPKSGKKGGATGLGGLWLFTLLWNAFAIPIAALVVPDVLESGEYVGLFVLLFPLVGMFLLWGALAASVRVLRGGVVDPSAAARRSATALPGSMAEQAARAMFVSPATAPRDGFGSGPRSSAPVLSIPPSLASVEERSGALTIRYARLRSLGLVVGLFVTGAILTAVSVAIFMDEGVGLIAVLVFLGATISELIAVAMLMSSLEVAVKGQELLVTKGGLFGRKSWRARREEITSFKRTVAYTVNNVPYFTVNAIRGAGESIPIGTSIRGEDLASHIAERVARALGVSVSRAGEERDRGSVAAESRMPTPRDT